MAAAHTAVPRHLLLNDLLKRVSRSFFLTVNVVPRCVRDQIGLAYLFARAADTIADTDLIERERRLLFLEQFRRQFNTDEVIWSEVQAIQTAVTPHQADSSERQLLERLEDCFRLYLELGADDRARIRTLMGTLTNGMV
ncbi:MAG: squalene/phytoene synthase family protein, partial [Nitrospirota bacterium]|nr:squalene/phytoene synthase family protein [Nitrospirota bacterium]